MRLVAPLRQVPPLLRLARAAQLANAYDVGFAWHDRWPEQVELSGDEGAVRTVVQILTRNGLLRLPDLGEA